MFDFAQGFPSQPTQPTSGPLNYQAEKSIQVRGFGEASWNPINMVGGMLNYAVGDDTVRVLDASGLRDGINWTHGELRKVADNREYGNLEYFINTLNGGKQNDAAVGLGWALEASQAMLLRQILGNNPLEPVMFAPSEITPEIMAAEEQELKGLLSTDNVPEESQKRVQEISNKKAYVESKTQADKNLGFNWWDWYKQTNVFNAASTLGVKVLGDKDIVEAVSEYDPNFKSAEWFDQFAADPIVKQGLLEHGITADTVAESPNADQAFMTISHIMYQSNTQKRMGTYKPTNYDFVKNMGSGLISFMVDTPTGATIMTGAAITTAASVFSPANFATVGAAALGEAAVLGESAVATSSTMAFLNGAKTLGETLYKLPLGMAPHWMEGSTLVSMTAANIASGAIQGTIGSYNQQAHEISFGAATMYMNPNTRREMNLSDAVIEGLYSGVEMGVLFGLGGGLLRSVKGMTDNGFKGLIIDPVTGRRNRLDRSFTFQDTPLGNTLQMLGIKDYERSLIDLKPVDVVRNEAILEKTDPTPDRLAAETEGYADRAEAREALKHPEAAEATPEDVGTRKYESETTEQYINRVAPSRTVRNLPELVTEVARRTQVEGGRMITSSEEYHQMTPQDQARTLIRTQAVLEAAKKAEEKAVGLPKERERVFEQLEASRKEALRRLGKTLTPLEFKRLKAEFKGEKPKAKGSLPELLAVAGDKTKPIAERKANAEEAAGQILETARAAAKNPAKMKVIKSKVPQEVLDKVDAIAAEEALTGRVSAETAEEVKRSLLNADEPFTSTLSKRIEQAVKVTRLSPDRVARINAIKEDHTRFVSLVKGNRGRAFALYNHINEGVISGILTPEDRILILASISHLNFDLKGFEMEYKYANMNDVNVAGEYNSRTRVLTLNTKCTPDKKAHTVLHEIGHALFSNDMYGEVYLENLKLYNSMRSGTPLSTDGIKLIDPLTTNLDKYHLQNVEESFVQLFSNVLLAETSQAMTTVESTVVRKTLAFIEKAILNATIALDESKYYERANSIIKALTEVDNKVIRQSVSVSSLLRAIAQAETTRPKNAAQFNFEILKSLRYRHPEVEINTIKNTFTDAEYKMLFKQVNDPTSLAAFAITRENGKPIVDEMGRFTVHAPKFFEAYSEYKKAQYNSAATRVAYMLRSMSYKLLVGMTKEEREKFLTYEIFDINATQKEGSPYANALGYNLAATYEDNHLASMNLNGGNYATDYLITTAESFVELLQEDGMSDAAPSALTLPAAEREALIRRIQEDPYMSKPIMEQLREHFDKAGLTQYYQKAFHKMQKDLILRMYEEGVFSMNDLKLVWDTPEFKQYFGNSKVVDKDGKPLIMYHGTSDTDPITMFNFDQHVDRNSARKMGLVSYLGRVFYFSKNAKDASDFALHERSGENASVYPVYLRIEKPFDTSVEFSHKDAKKLLVDFYEKLLEETPDNKTLAAQLYFLKTTLLESTLGKDIYKQLADIGGHADKANAYLQTLGYDGIIDHSSDMGVQYAVFKPEQIKSIWNDGTFSRTNPDIRRNINPEVSKKREMIGILHKFISDKTSFNSMPLDFLLRNVLGLEETLVVKYMNLGKSNPIKALQALQIAVSKDLIEHDGSNWILKLEQVSASEKVEPTIVSQTKANKLSAGVKLVTTKTLNAKLMEFYGNAESILREAKSKISIDTFRDVLGEFQTYGTDKRNSLIKKLEDGMSDKEVKYYIMRSAKNAEVSEYRASSKAESNETAEGKPKEGKKIQAVDKTKQRQLTANNYKTLQDLHTLFEKKTGSALFTPTQIETLRVLGADRIVKLANGKEEVAPTLLEDAAKILGLKSKSSVSERVNAIQRRIQKKLGLTDEATNKLFDPKAKLTNEMKIELMDKIDEALEKLKEAEKDKPLVEPELTAPAPEKLQATGNRILDTMATVAKMERKADPVAVPKTEETTGHATVETAVEKPKESLPVVHPEPVADALVSGETNMTKTAVQLDIKKSFSMKGVFTQASDALDRLFNALAIEYPDEVVSLKTAKEQHAFVVKLLKEKGYDSVIDERGNVVPLKEPKVVGKTKKRISKEVAEKQQDPTVVTKEETTFSTEEGVPVVTTETVVATPTAPTGPVETPAGDRTVVPEPTKGVSDVAKLPEAETLERKVNEDPKLLRNNGMDRSFLKLFTKAYWKSKVEGAGKDTLTTKFKTAWGDFVQVNQFIAEANKRMFGEDIMERFWKKVDEINAVDRIRPKAAEGPTGIKPLTYREVLDKAAAAMNEEGKPAFVRPLLPEEIKFVKADEAGTVRLSAKNKKTRAIVDAALTEAEKVEPPPVEKAMDAEGKPLPEDTTPIKPEDPTPPKSNDQLIDSAIDAPEAAASRPWRLNNFVGHLFGGDNTANATWWRKMMARLANATQSSSQLGNTIRSFNDSIAFISRWADDTRAQTGHVVGVGKTPFKTMLQIKMDEGRVITRILRAYSDFDTTLRGANKPAVQAYIYDCLRKGEQPNKAEMVKLGVGVHNAEAAVKKATYLLEISRAINDKILYMENTTGRLVTTDKLGMPLDPKKYAPVQFDHEALMRIPPGEHSKVIDAMVIARTATKLNDPRLDKNTMIVMGWIDVKYNEKTGGYDFYSKEREIKHSEAVNMFGNDTLAKLQVSKIAKEGMGGNKSILKNMLRKGDPNKYFIIESDTEYTVYRLPEVLDELGNADKAKYLEAVKGNTAHYTIEWRERLGNKNLIQREMEEMFAYKTKKAPYGNDNYGLVRSMFKLDENGQSGITVHGLTPEEMLSDPMLAKLLRTNLAEAYFHWVKGRYFDLGFQQELDRVMGTKGINWEMVTNRVRERAQKDITKIAIDSGWTNKQLESATTDINNGIKRLQEEFRAGAETLPFFANKGTLGSRAANAAIRFKFSAGYGVSQFTEILQELAKHSPEFYKIPKNVFTALRYVVGDYRISKNKLLMSELGDMTFVLEAFKTDLSNRFMGETGYGILTTDSRMGTRFAKVAQHIRNANGLGETLVTIGEGAAEGMQTLGSLSAQTQAVRVLGKVRMQGAIWHYFNNGSVEKLLTRLQDPKVAAELAELNKAAALDQSQQVKLWKRFAGVARESGFGMDQHDAMMFLKYGFGDPETVKAFKWAMSKVKHDNGRVNINLLWDLADQVAREGSKEVDPEVLGNALSNYQFMLEDRITKEVASEVRGLNRQTDLDSRSALGRLWYALSSFTRSYQDNVIMGYGSKSSLKYLAGGIFLYMAVDALTSYLKEYLAGRDHKDILQELEDHPSEFMIRGAARTPFLGTWNGFLEAGLAGASYLNGGTYRYYGIPGLPAGASAGEAALSDMYNSTKTLVGSDSDMGKRLKAASGLLGVSDIVNRSHAAIPIRVLQDMGAIEQQSATGTYLDLIHRKPYPYMKQTASAGNYQPMNPNDYEPTPRNFAKEASEYEAARQMAKEFPLPPERVVVPKRTATGRGTTRQMFNSTSPNRGVSGELGDLLDQ